MIFDLIVVQTTHPPFAALGHPLFGFAGKRGFEIVKRHVIAVSAAIAYFTGPTYTVRDCFVVPPRFL
jgi:hypothetical protein